MTIGQTLVRSKLARSASGIDIDDVLGVVGLARRRSHLAQNLAMLGVGAALGAGVALLLAPASGRETRKRLGQSVEKLGDQASAALGDTAPVASASTSRTNHGPAHMPESNGDV